MLKLSSKVQIWWFHVVVMQRTANILAILTSDITALWCCRSRSRRRFLNPYSLFASASKREEQENRESCVSVIDTPQVSLRFHYNHLHCRQGVMQLFFNVMHCTRVSAGFDGFFFARLKDRSQMYNWPFQNLEKHQFRPILVLLALSYEYMTHAMAAPIIYLISFFCCCTN